jgi:hypothetical protein
MRSRDRDGARPARRTNASVADAEAVSTPALIRKIAAALIMTPRLAHSGIDMRAGAVPLPQRVGALA